MKKINLLIALLFVLFNCYSQSIKTNVSDTTKTKKDSLEQKKTYRKFDINYQNNSVYLGRKDSLVQPYITPTFTYNHKSGLYVSASFGYLLASGQNRIDYYSIDAGYDFTLSEKLTGSVYTSKRFYNDGSNNIKSDIGGNLSASFNYDFDVVEAGIGFGASFAHKTDFDFNATFSRSFYLDENENWSVEPKANVNFSTLHFYEGYTSNTVSRKKGNNNTNVLSVTAVTKVAKNKLTLMNYEFAAPLSYDTKKYGFYFTPTVAVPKNPIYTTTTTTLKLRNGTTLSQTEDSTPDAEKNLKSSFYFEIGAYIKF